MFCCDDHISYWTQALSLAKKQNFVEYILKNIFNSKIFFKSMLQYDVMNKKYSNNCFYIL